MLDSKTNELFKYQFKDFLYDRIKNNRNFYTPIYLVRKFNEVMFENYPCQLCKHYNKDLCEKLDNDCIAQSDWEFKFDYKCPLCQKIITWDDFENNRFNFDLVEPENENEIMKVICNDCYRKYN